MSFGERLRALRLEAGLTQEELAARAGLTANGVSALERGARTRPYPHTLRVLAAALRLDGAEFESFVAAGRPEAAAPASTDRQFALPMPTSDLIGREAELTDLGSLIRDPAHRLVTLTGPGGVGKTRLAVEVARRAEHDYPDGTFFVGLASLSDPALVPSVIASCTGGRDGGGRLLVLDNFEHLLDAARAVTEMLAAQPAVTVLATSRARLRVTGEVENLVRPLALPASTRDPTAGEVSEAAAVRLFVQRARSVQPDFEITARSAAAVAAICWRLGGLPLAVELAASKVKTLSPADLLDRLDQALATGWSRDLPARQHTLRSTLDWSYRLLDEDAQYVLRRLSVFAGGFTLDSAEAVAAPPSGPGAVLTPLETLVEHSLVTVARDRDGETQYRLLEPIREYAATLLRESGDERAARAEHVAYFLAFAERAAPELHRHDQVLWLGRTEWQAGNLRAAMRSALSAGDGRSAARLAWALWHPWWNRGQLDEGRRCTEAVLGLDLPAPLRNRALIVHATMCASQGDLLAAERSHREALELARSGGDVTGRAYALVGLGMTVMRADPALADDLLHEAMPIAAEVGEEWLESLGLIALGTLRVAEGDPGRARQLFASALESTRARADGMLTCVALINVAQAAVIQNDDAAAESALRECVQLSTGLQSHVNMELIDVLLATIAGRRNDWNRCAVLLGCARRMGERTGTPIHASYLYDPALLAATRRDAAAALGLPAFEQALARGHVMTVEEAFAYAMGG